MYLYVVNFWRLQVFAAHFILFLTFFIITVCTNEIVDYTSSPSDSTTENTISDLCVNRNTSCSHQVSVYRGSQDSCSLVRYERTSEDCGSSSFRGDLDPEEEFGKVILSVYVLYSGGYTDIVFNVTFTDIKWTRARLRFYESGSNEPDICREFQLTSQVPSETKLFFDCPWNLNYESKVYHFQYIAYPRADHHAVTHQFVFFVPTVLSIGTVCSQCPSNRQQPLDIKKMQVFVSVDVSVLPVLKLQVQAAHEMYNITSYQIQLVRTLNHHHKWHVVDRIVNVFPNQSHIYLVHNTDYKPGIYNFSVTPLHESCNRGICSPSKAPGILIEDEEGFYAEINGYNLASTATPLLIAMVGTVILIPVLIAIYFMWRRTCVPRPTGNEPWQPPKVLLVYNPDYKSHVSDMIRFTEYLKRKCRVEPMFDLFCIPNSASKDPTKWYREAFRQADFILVFASPPGPKSTEPHKCNPYLHLDKIALNQLRIMLAVPGPSCRVVSVLLPGCSWETLPQEASRLRQFTLPRDLDPLLVCLGAAPQCDGGEGLRDALANDVRPDPQPIPQPEPLLQVTKKCISNRYDEHQYRSSELSRMNLMGIQNRELEPEVQRRPRRDDTLLDIGDLNLSGGC